MQGEVLIAVVSGIVGVISAIVAWAQASRANRLKAQVDVALEGIRSETTITLESMKEATERRSKALDLAIREAAPIEAVLSQLWQDIQVVKEIVSKLTSVHRHDSDIALEALQPAVRRIVDSYSRFGSDIPRQAREACHRAKASAGTVELIVREQLANGTSMTPLADNVVAILMEARRNLTDQQLALSVAREGLRKLVVERILELA